MNETAKKVAGTAGSALLLTTMGMGAAAAVTPAVAAPADGALAVEQATVDGTVRVAQDVVAGLFQFTQNEITPTATVVKNLAKAPDYLCGANGVIGMESALDADDWSIAVKGAVKHSFTMTDDDMKSSAIQTLVMGCSCAGNPADGTASVNVEVAGVGLAQLLDAAVPDASANTVVFTSADGYEVALPLDYVYHRYAPIVMSLNGEPLASSIGGANQLWLGSTAARYFARDIVAITVEARDEAPATPGTPEAGDDYDYLPNVGVFYGGDVE